jgi:DNA-binding response OmpR family regulator
VLGAGTAFLQKPFTPAALVQRVRETLDLAAASHPALTAGPGKPPFE